LNAKFNAHYVDFSFFMENSSPLRGTLQIIACGKNNKEAGPETSCTAFFSSVLIPGTNADPCFA
jgi:hypothetical protein